MTNFQLLVRTSNNAWSEWREEEASSAETAIRTAYMRDPQSDVLAIVAVPARSWRPQVIRTEQVTRLKLVDDLDAPEPEEPKPIPDTGHPT